MTEHKLISEYLSALDKLYGFSDRTIKCHRLVSARWQEFISDQPEKLIEKATPQNLLAFIKHRQASGAKETTVREDLCVLRTLYEYLFSYRKILWNPAASLPRLICEPPKEKDYLSVNECLKLLDGFDTSQPIGLRNYTIVALLWSTGLRTSELRSLKWRDIDLRESTLLVRNGKGGKQRQIFLNERITADLRKYQEHVGGCSDEPLFFGLTGKTKTPCQHLHPYTLRNIVSRAARTAGIDKPINQMTLRHTFATHMFEAGATIEEIKEVLGHDDETESTVYVHVSLDAAKRLLNDHCANPSRY